MEWDAWFDEYLTRLSTRVHDLRQEWNDIRATLKDEEWIEARLKHYLSVLHVADRMFNGDDIGAPDVAREVQHSWKDGAGRGSGEAATARVT